MTDFVETSNLQNCTLTFPFLHLKILTLLYDSSQTVQFLFNPVQSPSLYYNLIFWNSFIFRPVEFQITVKNTCSYRLVLCQISSTQLDQNQEAIETNIEGNPTHNQFENKCNLSNLNVFILLS